MLIQCYRSLLATFLLSAFCSGAYGSAFKLDLEDSEKLSPLKPQYGYVVFFLNVSGTAPSMFFQAIDPQPTAKKRHQPVREFQIDLSNRKKQFYFLQVPAGRYQINGINSPLYDFSYKLPLDKDRLWRFKVEANKVNFAGELSIKDLRDRNNININLFNRFALYNQQIQQQLASILAQYPLVNGCAYRDDFEALLNNTSGVDNAVL